MDAARKSLSNRKGLITKCVNNISLDMGRHDVTAVQGNLKHLRKTYDNYILASQAYDDAVEGEQIPEDEKEKVQTECSIRASDMATWYAKKVSEIEDFLYTHGVEDTSGRKPSVVVQHADDEDQGGDGPNGDVRDVEQEEEVPEVAEAVVDAPLTRNEVFGMMSMPKAEPVTFSGDPLEFHGFMLAFEEQIGYLHVPPKIKLSRLLQHTTGPARAAIRPCTLMDNGGYGKAWEILKTRFGNPFAVADAVVRNLKNGPHISTADEMSQLADDLSNAVSILQVINMSREINTQEALVKICERLPAYQRNKWRREVYSYKRKNSKYPDFDVFMSFVRDTADEMCDPIWGDSMYRRSKPESKPKSSGSRPPKQQSGVSSFSVNTPAEKKPASSASATQYRRPPCLQCKGDHNLLVCTSFRALQPSDRWALVQKNKLCVNCLKVGHHVDNCRSAHVCSVGACGQRHSNFLHTASSSSTVATTQVREVTALTSTDVPIRDSNLPCVNVRVNGQLVSALLDTGSNHTFCDRHLARTLGLKGRPTNCSVTTLTSESKNINSELIDVFVTSEDGKEGLDFKNVYVIDNIPVKCSNVRDVDYSHLRDVKFPKLQTVRMLIGQDQSEALLPLEVRKGRRREPFATRTLFGWALNGPNRIPNVTSSKVVANFISSTAKTELDTNALVRMDDEGVCDEEGMSLLDEHVVKLWDNECTMQGGKYQIPIPFKTGIEVPNNFQAALSRLQRNKHSLVKRDLFSMYDAEIRKLISEGYAEEVPSSNSASEHVWYLPHQAVVTDKKPGKLRVVFDCAAKFKGESLNDKCLQGPNFTNKLLNVLLRFRQDPFAVVGDVQAMYYQVVIPPEQRDALRFLWYVGDRVVHYRMTRHVFGGIWCSSSSSYALLRTIRDNPGYPKIVVDTIRECFYVDDCLRSLPDRESVPLVIEGTRELLSKGGFKLTKFVVNDPELMDLVPVADRAKEVSLVKDGPIDSKALGISWSVVDDMFYFVVNLEEFVSSPLSRRKLLSLVSSLYDPLGLVGPMVVLGRLVLQEVTRLKFGWDDKLPDALVERWKSWVDTLQSLSEVRIPRCIKPLEFNDAALEIHNFSDASQVAYGTASYLRCTNKSGQVSVRLIMAKSKVAPINSVTIPRLELQAALLAARVDSTLRSELRLPLNSSYFWVDSEIVLCYLSNSSRRFKTFVANRVSAIQSVTSLEQWHFVPGIVNPADLITRGKEMTAEEQQRWYCGPEFLHSHKSDWPSFSKSPGPDPPEDDPEVRSKSCFAARVCKDRLSEIFLRHSSWYYLLRSLVWISRLFEYVRNEFIPARKITLPEIDRVEIGAIKYVQEMKYSSEIRALKAGSNVPLDSSIISLSPVLDSQGVIVVGGRVRQGAWPDARQIIIPHDHPIASMIASDYHGKAHCGTEWTTAEIRKKFWITKIRVVVKSVSSKCIFCKKFYGPPCGQRMSDLPLERVVPGDKPFSYVGLDCFGPFETKLGRITVKRYGCIFTCFSIRAVHIEKLDSMDTDSFLNAFRRFIARRGRPSKVWSDNGSNFVGGTKEMRQALQRLDTKAILEFGLQQSIDWNFNPPTASHMGGVWERLIRTVRKVFMGISGGDFTFNDEVLSTWFCEVESIVNGRPITKVGDDAADSAPLTPNHLLLLAGQNYGPPGEFSGALYGRRWRRVQHLSDVFWKRWVREYLPELQVRSKWHREKENLRVGDFVLLLDEETPRTLWPQGVVTDVYPGGDGLVRKVRVRTKSRALLRPVNKVVLLEGSSVES